MGMWWASEKLYLCGGVRKGTALGAIVHVVRGFNLYDIPMRCVGLLSDTHGVWDDAMADFFAPCDELWHAGDIGGLALADTMARYRPLRAVHGNIDDAATRAEYPEYQHFEVEGLWVLMLHIGGAPGHYAARVVELLAQHRADVLVCGHSHILRVERDASQGVLYMNPGASGFFGPHAVRTALRFQVSGGRVGGLEVWERSR